MRNTYFWDECWAGKIPLKLKFSRFYNLCIDKSVRVGEMEEWNEGVCQSRGGNDNGGGIFLRERYHLIMI